MADKKIDPRIYIPPVEGYTYDDREMVEGASFGGTTELELPDGITTSPVSLAPPDRVTIVEQIYRKGADGKTVVDLVIEVEDVPGATEYEVRTSLV